MPVIDSAIRRSDETNSRSEEYLASITRTIISPFWLVRVANTLSSCEMLWSISLSFEIYYANLQRHLCQFQAHNPKINLNLPQIPLKHSGLTYNFTLLYICTAKIFILDENFGGLFCGNTILCVSLFNYVAVLADSVLHGLLVCGRQMQSFGFL